MSKNQNQNQTPTPTKETDEDILAFQSQLKKKVLYVLSFIFFL